MSWFFLTLLFIKKSFSFLLLTAGRQCSGGGHGGRSAVHPAPQQGGQGQGHQEARPLPLQAETQELQDSRGGCMFLIGLFPLGSDDDLIATVLMFLAYCRCGGGPCVCLWGFTLLTKLWMMCSSVCLRVCVCVCGGAWLLRKGSLGLLWSKIYMDAKINILSAEYPEHWFILPASLKQIRK